MDGLERALESLQEYPQRIRGNIQILRDHGQRLALDDAIAANGVLARMVTVHDQHRHLLGVDGGEDHAGRAARVVPAVVWAQLRAAGKPASEAVVLR